MRFSIGATAMDILEIWSLIFKFIMDFRDNNYTNYKSLEELTKERVLVLHTISPL